ncbi:hypothetical protein C7434_3752 [Pantoea sp. PNA 14-12]|uniref:hypothetical protein n=1 Tax=Pantoea TaxID=53335 RepID=UPI000D5F78F3|nr:hypothetical protein [Pantoea]PVY84048.1 hypothetical protein C7427_105262 [Pantoea ananatis]TDS68007.1 hypothetical protein C7434_3752 [Pantoea sp. PNA 14-12]
MRILGVRAAPKAASFIVYCTTEKCLKCADVVVIPATLDTPEKLKYVRNNILDILRTYDVQLAAIRVAESNSKNLSIDRLYIEAVIQEAFSSSEILDYSVVRKTGIKASLKLNEKQYKDFINSHVIFENINNTTFSQETNEAVLAALSVEARLC